MMEYQVLTSDSRPELVTEVTAAIEEGWQPLGGVSVSTFERADGLVGLLLAQAMVSQRDNAPEAER